MAVSRKKKKANGRPRILGPKVVVKQDVAPSLPPEPDAETPQVAAILSPKDWTDRSNRPPKDHPAYSWWLPEDSKVRPVAMQIIAMRLSGMSDADIAKHIGISEKSISPYVYRATRNGWLDIDYNPKERIQFQVMHKVVQQLEEGLADGQRMNTGMKVRTAVALKVAEGTLFKQFDQQQAQVAPSTVVAVQVIMPDGPRQEIREDTTGGTPAYIDAETGS